MEPDDLEPQRKKPVLRDLSQLGVAELQDYIADLEAKIARARAVIATKQSHRGAADAFFKKG